MRNGDKKLIKKIAWELLKAKHQAEKVAHIHVSQSKYVEVGFQLHNGAYFDRRAYNSPETAIKEFLKEIANVI